MEINKIPELAKQIALQYGYPIPTIKMSNKMIRKLGTSYKFKSVIQLSRKFCEINSEEIIISLLKHEIAHFKYDGHGWDFKTELIRMGCHDAFIGSHLKDHSEIKSVHHEPKYIFQCPNGHTHGYYKLPKDEHSCGKCDKKFNRDYLLKRIK